MGAAETDPLTRLAQVVTELAQAREAILRQAAALDLLRTQTQAELAASEQRTRALVASIQPSRGDDRFDVIDFKSASPTAFSGRREESWKKWSRQFRTYCNARKDGFRAALVWAEQSQVEINHNTIDSMGWAHARVADSKLYDFLLLTTNEDALVLVEHYEGMGFEAWRQMAKRFNPTGGQYELDMMSQLMNPTAATSLTALPGAVDRFERDLRTYESKTGRAFPEEWKVPLFMKFAHNAKEGDAAQVSDGNAGLCDPERRHPRLCPGGMASGTQPRRYAGGRTCKRSDRGVLATVVRPSDL